MLVPQTKKGKLAMAGALVDPVDAGLLIFRNCTKEVGAPGLGGRRTANCMARVYGSGAGIAVLIDMSSKLMARRWRRLLGRTPTPRVD